MMSQLLNLIRLGIYKVRRLLFSFPDDGVKFHQLTTLNEDGREAARLLRDPNNLLLFGSKMDVRPDTFHANFDKERIKDFRGQKPLTFIRLFTNSKGNLFRVELIVIHETGLVEYSCLNRVFYRWMVYEPVLWSGSEGFLSTSTALEKSRTL